MLRMLLLIGCFHFSFLLHAQTSGFEYIDTSIIESETERLRDEGYIDGNEITYNNIYIPDTVIHLAAVIDFTDSAIVWKQDEGFGYLKGLDSMLRAKQKQSDQQQRNVQENAGKGISFIQRILASSFLQVLLWTLAIIAVGYILYRLFLKKGILANRIKKKKLVEELSNSEILSLGSYQHLIDQSLAKNDFRQATRYCFLQTLFILSDKNFLEFAAEKTNAEYKRELPVHLKQDFAKLVLNYEYVWYGHIEIEETQYRNIEKLFEQFNNRI